MSLRRIRWSFALLLLLAVPIAGEQRPVRLDDILDRWAKALGGKESLRKITGMYVKAVIVVGGQIGTMENWQTSKGEYKTIVSLGDNEFITVCDGQAGWAAHNGTVSDLDGDGLAAAITRSYLGSYSQFFPEREAGSAEFVREDSDAFVIKLSPKGGLPLTFYLDKTTGLPLKHEIVDSGRSMTFFYDEWKDYGNVKTWRRGRQTSGDAGSDLTVTTQEVRWNPQIDPAIFRKPTS